MTSAMKQCRQRRLDSRSCLCFGIALGCAANDTIVPKRAVADVQMRLESRIMGSAIAIHGDRVQITGSASR